MTKNEHTPVRMTEKEYAPFIESKRKLGETINPETAEVTFTLCRYPQSLWSPR
jgi:hypothetical protein